MIRSAAGMPCTVAHVEGHQPAADVRIGGPVRFKAKVPVNEQIPVINKEHVNGWKFNTALHQVPVFLDDVSIQAKHEWLHNGDGNAAASSYILENKKHHHCDHGDKNAARMTGGWILQKEATGAFWSCGLKIDDGARVRRHARASAPSGSGPSLPSTGRRARSARRAGSAPARSRSRSARRDPSSSGWISSANLSADCRAAAPPFRPAAARSLAVVEVRRLGTRVAELDAARLRRRKRRLGALTDRLALLFGDQRHDADRHAVRVRHVDRNEVDARHRAGSAGTPDRG